MRHRLTAVTLALAALTSSSAALADAGGPKDRGRAILVRACARCHAVGLRGSSPRPGAPAFRDLHERYPVELLGEALAEGILTGHPEMPQLVFAPEQIRDITAYLAGIQGGPRRPSADAPGPRSHP